ncbi:MAG: aminotransferase class I/II-fold pyridoxal phosphate-dependent enzyme [Pseudomonadota bacterium]
MNAHINLDRPIRHEPEFLDALMRERMAEGSVHPTRTVLGATEPGPGAIQLRSNDYLALASDPRIAYAKAEALQAEGHGDAISRVFAHQRNDRHRAFERRMASWLKAEDAVLAMSGYSANTGLIQAFARPDQPVYIDQRAHASLRDGITMAGARARVFRHNSPDHLETLIARHGPGLIAVDALYSTDGAICPLEDMVALAERTGSALIVDETHSFGCAAGGAGLCEELGLSDRVHFRTVGLSKAMTARGGVVAGSARAMEFLRYEARPMIFSTSVLGYEIAGFDKTLDIIAAEPWRRARLRDSHHRLTQGLLDLGYEVAESDRQIVAITTGTDSATVRFRDALAAQGLFGSVFCAPATPVDRAIIRLTLNADLTRHDIARALQIFAKARRALH